MSKPKRLRECDDWEEVPMFGDVPDGRVMTMDYTRPSWTIEAWLILQWAIRPLPLGKRHFTIGAVNSRLGIGDEKARPALATLTTYGLLSFDGYNAKWCPTGKAREVFKAFGLEAIREAS